MVPETTVVNLSPKAFKIKVSGLFYSVKKYHFFKSLDIFPKMFGYPYPSRRFTMGLASVVYDVLDDYIIHASFHHYLASERSAAIEHLKSLETLNIYENSVVIFDRGYYSEKLFSYCVEHGHMCLMRLKETYNIFIIGFMKRLLPKILCTISTIDEINRLYSEAVRNRSQIMPGRTFKRKKNKAKGRTHFNNQKVSF